ncbi:hypothetical protein QFC19_003913 [Naganishia cerealis]|uniref:Uncharacterized protein n=1 Tax=Naganishia cerealis TaxID=610337 RepID=A0ACC2W106_9TREE|nr:hypothetical protein QFC19_003913 [Naganishia cerealis]
MIDPTHGRYLLPTTHVENALDASPEISTLQRRVFFDPNERASSSKRIIKAENITLTEDELRHVRGNDEWTYYKVWEMKDEFLEDTRGRGVDVVYVHGYREYGFVMTTLQTMPWAKQIGLYANIPSFTAGFRVILPDMPGVRPGSYHGHGALTSRTALMLCSPLACGRSKSMVELPDVNTLPNAISVHGFLPNARSLPDAVFTVLQDLRTLSPSPAASPPRKVFLTGTSMGGLTVLYALTVADRLTEEEREKMPPVNGAFAMCPLLDVPDRPNAVVTAVGKLLCKVAGKVPLLDGGPIDLISDDPRVPAEFRQDPMNYTGKLRIATGIALLNAFTETVDNAGYTKTPIRLLHGDADRTTSHKASMKYMDAVTSADKSIKIYKGYQHVMVKIVDGKSEEADFANNSAVLNDWKAWLLERA